MRTARLILPVAVLALLAGCSGDGSDPTPTPDRAQSEDSPEKVRTDDGAADDGGDDTDAPTGDLAACIIGEWAADASAVVAATDAMLEAAGMTSSTVVTGESFTTIDATTISTTYVDQTTESTIDVAGQTIVSRASMNGTLTQPYTLDGDVLTSVAGDMSGVEMESTVLVDGQAIPGYEEGFQQGLDAGVAAGQTGRQTITCSDDTLTMTTLDLAALGMDEITVTMTRR